MFGIGLEWPTRQPLVYKITAEQSYNYSRYQSLGFLGRAGYKAMNPVGYANLKRDYWIVYDINRSARSNGATVQVESTRPFYF